MDQGGRSPGLLGGAGVFAAVGERFAGWASSRDARSFRPEPPGPGEQTTMQRLMAEIRSALQLRGWVLKVGVPILAMIPVGIAVVIVAGANSGGGRTAPTPSATGLGFPPATLAAAAFTTTPGQQGRGLSQTITQVASNGNEIVGIGTQTGANVARARFFVSQDAGRTWRLGTETAPGGANPPPGHAPAFVTAGPKGWAAVGPDSVWTSPDGVNWTLQSATGPAAQAGDRINVLTRTANGFLAAGQNTANGTTTPVVWLSANGTAWQRVGAGQLQLKGATSIRFAAASQNGIVIAGAVAGGGDGVWRSANGTAWTQVTVPVAGGAQNTIAGVAQLAGKLVAVRPAVINGSNQAIAYTSQTGTTWTQSAQITTTDKAPLTLGPVSGGQSGAVITGAARGLLIAFFSADGVNWQGSSPFGTTATETFTGVALTTGNVAVTTATQTGNARRTPVITLIAGQGQLRNINVNAIPGAVQHELAVNAVAAAGGTQVAAGSADGFPALWASADGGTTWKRGTGAALTRGGVQQVTGVAHGPAGWVAVGGVTGAAKAHPVVVTSADGAAWTQADEAPAFAGGGLTATGVAAGHGGYAIVGTQTTGPQTTAVAWFSAGLTAWQQVAPGGGAGTAMSAVASTAGGFVAVGSKGTAPAAWLSPNGQGWALRTLPLPNGAARAVLTFVAANGNKIAAIGTQATAAGQVTPFAATSTDGGKNWTETALPVPSGTATVSAVAASGAGFTATGAFGASPGNKNVVIWTLPASGTTWTASTLQGRGLNARGIQEITALTAAGNALIGIGFQATATAEEPIIWQAPIRG